MQANVLGSGGPRSQRSSRPPATRRPGRRPGRLSSARSRTTSDALVGDAAKLACPRGRVRTAARGRRPRCRPGGTLPCASWPPGQPGGGPVRPPEIVRHRRGGYTSTCRSPRDTSAAEEFLEGSVAQPQPKYGSCAFAPTISPRALLVSALGRCRPGDGLGLPRNQCRQN